MNTQQALRNEYFDVLPKLERFRVALAQQIEELLHANNITLAVPLEHRVKTWNSISEKTDRKSLELEHIYNLEDLVGVRAIVLFQRDR